VDEPVPDALRDALDGNAQAIETPGFEHQTVPHTDRATPARLLTRSALSRVLRDLRDGHISADQAQRWASFMRRGYVSTGSGTGPIHPIDIEYEDEDAIVEPLARLDELGDLIDGTMSDDELNDWIVKLSC
jgi:hypothetical protein